MPREADRRRKKSRLYDIVIVPLAEGARTRRYQAGVPKLVMAGLVLFFLSVGITLAVLMFTPLAMYVPIPNPGLEERYGRQISETRQQLETLTADVSLLKDYNQQLRKALGEGASGDSMTTRSLGPSVIVDDRVPDTHAKTQESHTAAPQSTPQENVPGEYGTEPDFSLPSYGMAAVTETAHASFPLVAPTDGFVTQNFDPSRRHYGMDYAGKRGTPVCAATNGQVVFAGWTYEDGNLLILSHGGGYLTVYKHNQLLLKTAQATVRRGEPIALLGTSGRTSLGPHLHFEVWKDGIPRDPNEFLLTPSRVQ